MLPVVVLSAKCRRITPERYCYREVTPVSDRPAFHADLAVSMVTSIADRHPRRCITAFGPR
jgi:hypothetical protein